MLNIQEYQNLRNYQDFLWLTAIPSPIRVGQHRKDIWLNGGIALQI